jgi:hypothetical protein
MGPVMFITGDSEPRCPLLKRLRPSDAGLAALHIKPEHLEVAVVATPNEPADVEIGSRQIGSRVEELIELASE